MNTPQQRDELRLRVKISEVLVKWGMPTRQAAINDILKLFEAHTNNRIEELLDRLQPEDWKGDNTQLNITRDDFYKTIEVERLRLKEGL